MISVPDKSALSRCAQLVHLPAHAHQNLNKRFCWACARAQRWNIPFFQMCSEIAPANLDLILGRQSSEANRDWFVRTLNI